MNETTPIKLKRIKAQAEIDWLRAELAATDTELLRRTSEMAAEIDRLRGQLALTKDEGDVFLRNVKERDAEIDRLRAALATAKAELERTRAVRDAWQDDAAKWEARAKTTAAERDVIEAARELGGVGCEPSPDLRAALAHLDALEEGMQL